MADVDRVAKLERRGQLNDVSGIRVHLVADSGLSRAAVAAAIMRYHAVALLEKEHHLVVPVIGAERPAVVEDDRLRLLRPPVLVEDLYAVSRRDGGHIGVLLRLVPCNQSRDDTGWRR